MVISKGNSGGIDPLLKVLFVFFWGGGAQSFEILCIDLESVIKIFASNMRKMIIMYIYLILNINLKFILRR